MAGGSGFSERELLDLECNIAAAKGFLELLYGCYSGSGSDYITTDNLLYLVTDADDRLKKSLSILRREAEVTP